MPNYRIYLKLMVDGVTARPFSAATLPPFNLKTSAVVESEIIKMSQKRYSRPRAVVEAEINRWSGIMGPSGEVDGTAGAGMGMAAIPGAGGASSSRGAGGAGGSGNGSMVKHEVVCSSCGKTTTVPFEPTPGRPIYCRDCLKKIEAGELQPVRMPRMPAARRTQKKYADDLGNLGIEFPESTPEREFAPQPQPQPQMQPYERPQAAPQRIVPGAVVPAAPAPAAAPMQPRPMSPAPAPAPRIMTPVASHEDQPTGPTLSLSDLRTVTRTARTKSPQSREKEEVDINEFRNAIKASLRADLAAATAAAAQDVPKEEDDDDEDKEHLTRH